MVICTYFNFISHSRFDVEPEENINGPESGMIVVKTAMRINPFYKIEVILQYYMYIVT